VFNYYYTFVRYKLSRYLAKLQNHTFHFFCFRSPMPTTATIINVSAHSSFTCSLLPACLSMRHSQLGVQLQGQVTGVLNLSKIVKSIYLAPFSNVHIKSAQVFIHFAATFLSVDLAAGGCVDWGCCLSALRACATRACYCCAFRTLSLSCEFSFSLKCSKCCCSLEREPIIMASSKLPATVCSSCYMSVVEN